MIADMKRKLKSYLAFTSVPYRIVGLLLLPCLLLALSIFWMLPGGYRQLMVFTYVVFYEIMADHWMLGGCLSDGGRGLIYFRTSLAGTEVVKNVVLMDLARRFLYCMVFAVTSWILTGQKCDIVNGLAAYCIIVGVLNGSRHTEGFQLLMCIAFLAQFVMFAVGVLQYWMFWLGVAKEGLLTLLLAVLYGATAIVVSGITIRRIAGRVRRA